MLIASSFGFYPIMISSDFQEISNDNIALQYIYIIIYIHTYISFHTHSPGRIPSIGNASYPKPPYPTVSPKSRKRGNFWPMTPGSETAFQGKSLSTDFPFFKGCRTHKCYGPPKQRLIWTSFFFLHPHSGL